MGVNGAINRKLFDLYVQTQLALTLRKGDVPASGKQFAGLFSDPPHLDILSSHKSLRVYPRSYSFLAKPSEHGSNCGPSQGCPRISVQAFPVLGQAATAIGPADGPLDHPPLWQDNEFGNIRALDDPGVDLTAGLVRALLELRSPAAAVRVGFQQGRIPAEPRAHQQDAPVAVLNTGRMDNGLHQETLGIDEDVTLLALDLLAGVKTRRVDADPPFSALLTL